jgi:excisionase family DNA binding protein
MIRSDTEPWVTPQELADELRVPLATIYQWRYRGDGPVGHRIGRHVRYRRQDIERWLVRRRDTPPNDGRAS